MRVHDPENFDGLLRSDLEHEHFLPLFVSDLDDLPLLDAIDVELAKVFI